MIPRTVQYKSIIVFLYLLKGLQNDMIELNRETFGPNIVPAPKKKPLWIAYFEQMANLFTFVLMLCGSLSIIVFIIDTNLWVNLYTGLIFWAVALFNAGLEFWQAYSSAKTLEGFLSLVPANCLVRRANQLMEIPAGELVVGDVVIVKTGNKIPADLRVLWSDNLRVDNSSLSGESEPQERNAQVSDEDIMESKNLLLSGTNVISGDAVCLVIRTGPRSVIGRLAEFAVKEPPRKSMLERETTVLYRRLVLTSFFFAMLSLTLGFSLGMYVTYAIDAATSIFVSFLPQGLPATMTILLTSAAKRMAARNVLVKNLRSVETLGAMTMLATDKTGTLTQNRMAVVGAWIHGQVYDNVEQLTTFYSAIEDFLLISTLCTACRLDPSERDKPIDERKIHGDATECGILKLTGKVLEIDDVFEENKKVLELPFSSATKWHLTIWEIEGCNRVIMKGAPERILDRCATYRKGDKTLPVDDDMRREFQKKYETFAGFGLRIIAVASKTLPADQYPLGFHFEKDPLNFPTDGLEFRGLICLRDPPKEGVAWAISRLREAHVQVVMVTGDHPYTAEAIARQVGILTLGDAFKRPPMASDIEARPHVQAAVIHGETLDSLTSSDWRRLTSMKEIVFARTAPRHKLEIVRQFQSAGHIVAVSGDGVNDSPALRKANLGVSMNLTASDVSKDAAQLILLDDNFVSIVSGVYEGRLIFENVKKSIRYTLTHISAEISAMLLYALLIIPPPLSPILLIFIDVAAELGPAISFAHEPAEYDLMVLPPRHAVEPFVDVEIGARRRFNAFKIPSKASKLLAKVYGWFFFPSTGENLIDSDLAIWSFLQGGIIVAAGAWGAYVLALAVYNVPFDSLYKSFLVYFTENSPPLLLTNGQIATASQQEDILGRLQASFFQAILIVQWFNIFMQKHRYRYPFGKDMFQNRLTYVGIASAACVLAIVCYIPGLQEVFQTNYPPALALASPFTAGIILVLYEFIRHFLRIKGYFGGIPDARVLVKPTAAAEVPAPADPFETIRLSIARVPSQAKATLSLTP